LDKRVSDAFGMEKPGDASEIEPIPFLGDTDRCIRARRLSTADYESWRLPGSETAKGVHVKEFLTNSAGTAWMVKTGAVRESHPNHTDLMERGRRIAFPLNEAVSSILFRSVGILTNLVALGFRSFHVPRTGRCERLLVSFHEMRAGILRSDRNIFTPPTRYVETFSV
jgi:hypothetical protein